MNPIKGIDVAWARPTVTQIQATGAHFVCRYLSPDQTKNIHAAEVTAYKAAGLGTVVVWESTAGRALQGRAAGVADAAAAEVQRAAVGLPSGMPIHFAVDTDTTWGAVQAYFDGVVSVLGKARTGCYGGVRVIEGAHGYGLTFLWQTVAWSGGVWSAHATIRQPGGTLLAGGADVDYAYADDYGQYPRPAQPKPPTPAPKPPVPVFVEDDMLAYLPIPANQDVDVPVEPAGTAAHPQGGAHNGPAWFSAAPQGADATITVSWHYTSTGKWGPAVTHKLARDGAKYTSTLPTDGSVDKIRVHSNVPLLAYVVGRQVA